ncbi:hypothetical protein F383_03671 [Gossypium arboreum]|uniref:Uncharacterized protein n=1 Tax=Gossypium arboreum TaxID=29729 RepID=A0A0B0NVM6_GOSAR|nr:hypothetical protein F383_03671 [Gossypium arboreum]
MIPFPSFSFPLQYLFHMMKSFFSFFLSFFISTCLLI